MKMRVFTVVTLFCAVAVSYGIVTFNAYDDVAKDAYDIMNILMRRRTPERYMPKFYFHKYGIKSSSKLTSFSVKNCGDPSSETAQLVNLKVTPDPIQIPGQIGVEFGVDFFKQAASPLQAGVVIKKKVLSNWITVPCIDQFGSCNYDDFCEILDMIPQCPQPFIDHGVPCKCPFSVGNYTLPMTTFEVDSPIPLPSGDYFGQLNMTMNGQPVACYQVTLTFA